MNVILFGASGMIGSRILRELVSRGHSVTAVVRDPSKIEGHENVIVTAGDMNDPAGVAEAVIGADAVVSAYGPGNDNPGLVAGATRSLIEGMKRAKVQRLITVGGAGGLEVAPGVKLIEAPGFLPEWKGVAQAHEAALDILRESSLDWTTLSPAAVIQPGKRTGNFRLGGGALLTDANGKSEISVEDYAIALVDELENPRHLRQRFTVAW